MNTTNSLPPTARVTCIYHSADNDGKMSACLLRTFFANVYPYGTNHGQPFNFGSIPNGSYVFIVDFSFKPSEMRALRERCTVIWIDHHPVYQQEDYQEFNDLDGIRSTEHSAAYLTWKYLYPGEFVPEAVEYVSDYDTWSFKYPQSMAFYQDLELLNIRPYPYNDKVIDDILHNTAVGGRMIGVGQEILQYIAARNKILSNTHAFKTEIEGVKAWAINTRGTNSLVLDEANKQERRPLRITFGFNTTIGAWRATVYSDDPAIKANDIARKFGGNGHDGAAGFIFRPGDRPFSMPSPSAERLTEDHIMNLRDIRGVNPILGAAESFSTPSLMKSFGYETKLFGLNVFLINNPLWTSEALYLSPVHVTVDFAALWSFTKFGSYLVRIYPIVWNEGNLDKLMTLVPNAERHADSVWTYLPELELNPVKYLKKEV